MKVTVKKIDPDAMRPEETIIEAYERLLQENKDLRVSKGHLRDEVKALKTALSKSNDDGMACANALAEMLVQVSDELEATKHELASTQLELRDREERVHILEQRVACLEDDKKQLIAEVECEKQRAELFLGQRDSANELRKSAEDDYRYAIAELNKAQKQIEQLEAENDGLIEQNSYYQLEISQLTEERDAAVNDNTETTFDYTELEETLANAREEIKRLEDELDTANQCIEDLIDIKNDYAETIADLQMRLDRAEVPDPMDSLIDMLVRVAMPKE